MSQNKNVKTQASRTNWNVVVSLDGYQGDFERSPQLGTDNIRVRPTKPREFVMDRLKADPSIMQETNAQYGLGLTDEECADPAMHAAFANEAFPILCGKLDGLAGYGGPSDPNAPSIDRGLSFRVSAQLQRNIRSKSGSGSVTGPVAPTLDAETLKRRVEEQRAKLNAAKSGQPAPTDEPTTKKKKS